MGRWLVGRVRRPGRCVRAETRQGCFYVRARKWSCAALSLEMQLGPAPGRLISPALGDHALPPFPRAITEGVDVAWLVGNSRVHAYLITPHAHAHRSELL